MFKPDSQLIDSLLSRSWRGQFSKFSTKFSKNLGFTRTGGANVLPASQPADKLIASKIAAQLRSQFSKPT